MENLVFKKIEMWILLLVLVAGFITLILYGALVRHVALGQSIAGALGDTAYALASIPSYIKDIAEGPPDFIEHGSVMTAFEPDVYEPLSITRTEKLNRIPLFWTDESRGPFQPAAMMFRLNDEKAEHLVILDEKRQVVRNFPVTAGSISGRFPPLVGNSSPRILPDGSYIVHSHGSDGLYRKDLCGNVVWSAPGLFHHSFSIADGKLGILGLPKENVTDAEQSRWNSSDILNIIDLESGKVDRSVPLRDIVRANIDTIDPLMWRTWYDLVDDNGVLTKDLVHLNKLEILSREMAAQYPAFPAGSWLVSSRHLNLVFIVDPATLKILWFSHGHTQGQHDPDFIGNNRVIVFNNGLDKNVENVDSPANFSRINAFDFSSESWSELYNAAPANGYTGHSGEVAYGIDGSLLLTLSKQGRYLEVASSGDVLSDFINIRDDDSVYWTKSAQYLTDEQFEIARNIQCQPVQH